MKDSGGALREPKTTTFQREVQLGISQDKPAVCVLEKVDRRYHAKVEKATLDLLGDVSIEGEFLEPHHVRVSDTEIKGYPCISLDVYRFGKSNEESPVLSVSYALGVGLIEIKMDKGIPPKIVQVIPDLITIASAFLKMREDEEKGPKPDLSKKLAKD